MSKMYGNHTFKSHAKNSYPALQAHKLVPIGWREARTIDDIKRPKPLYRKKEPSCHPQHTVWQKETQEFTLPPCHQVSCSLNASLNLIVNHWALFFIKCPLVHHSMARGRWGNLWQQCHVHLLFQMERLQKEPICFLPLILLCYNPFTPRDTSPWSKNYIEAYAAYHSNVGPKTSTWAQGFSIHIIT